MPVVRPQYTPIRGPRGKLVHIGMLTGGLDGRTACDIPCRGWRIATRDLVTCKKCRAAVHLRIAEEDVRDEEESK